MPGVVYAPTTAPTCTAVQAPAPIWGRSDAREYDYFLAQVRQTLNCLQAYVGGSVSSSQTLAGVYANGAAAADQTISLLDTKGGRIVIDGTAAGFTADRSLLIIGKGLDVQANLLYCGLADRQTSGIEEWFFGQVGATAPLVTFTGRATNGDAWRFQNNHNDNGGVSDFYGGGNGVAAGDISFIGRTWDNTATMRYGDLFLGSKHTDNSHIMMLEVWGDAAQTQLFATRFISWDPVLGFGPDAVGQIVLGSNGTAVVPLIVFPDTTTGWYKKASGTQAFCYNSSDDLIINGPGPGVSHCIEIPIGTLYINGLNTVFDYGQITMARNDATTHKDDTFGGINFAGVSPAGGISATAIILAQADEDWAAGAPVHVGTRMAFQTATNGGGTLAERFRISGKGNLLIGTTTDSATGPGVMRSLTAEVGVPGSATGAFTFNHGTSTKLTAFQSGNATADATYTWPLAPPTATGQSLTGTTAGVLSWSAVQAGTRWWSGQYTGGVGATTDYFADTGAVLTAPLFTTAQSYPSPAGTYRNLRVYVTTNTLAATMTVTVYKNGAATGLTVSFTAGATGLQSDTTHTVAFTAGDTLDLVATATAAGLNQASLAASVEYGP